MNYHENLYINHILKKIKLKEKQFDSLTKMILSYKSEIEKHINSLLEKHNINSSEIFVLMDLSNNNKILEISEYEDLLKKLYKNLAIISHPDKLQNNQNEINIDFINIKNAFENRNILALIDYSNKYNVFELNDLDETLLTLILERHFTIISEKIKNIKKSVYYQFLISNDTSKLTKYIEETISLITVNKQLKELNEKLKESKETLKQNKNNNDNI